MGPKSARQRQRKDAGAMATMGRAAKASALGAYVRRARAALVSPETSTQPPAAAGANDDGEVKSTKYFGVAFTPDDAREIADIEGWDDETLRGNQDCRSPHGQWPISLVRQKKTHDKDGEAAAAAVVTARLERLAATAPADESRARGAEENRARGAEESRARARAACDARVGGKKETERATHASDAVPWRAGGGKTPSDAATGG